MASDNKNTNELVADDDDPTAELEVLKLEPEPNQPESGAHTSGMGADADGNANDSISELKSDLQTRTETISKLQFDIEHLRSRWLGLEKEIGARQEISDKLNDELAELRETLNRKETLLKERDDTIQSLKAEIRERHDDHRALLEKTDSLREEISKSQADHELDVEGLQQSLAGYEERVTELQRSNEALNQVIEANENERTEKNNQLIAEQSGQLAGMAATIREMRDQQARAETYADALRRKLQDAEAVATTAQHDADHVQPWLDAATEKVAELTGKLEEEAETRASLQAEIESLRASHDEELRTLRFELGEAQETVAQNELINEQLASDLVETRGTRLELEGMLSKFEETNKAELERLERENRTLRQEAKELEEKLETKSEAINCLLAELAKKTQQIESIGEIEDVIQEIDDRMSERIDERVLGEKDRVTRVLIGSVEGQELRFPLFKDRLTIGRTEQNDIQLKAAYISRRHAVIATEGERTRVVDWGSKNGVFVNGKQVSEHFLKHGDIVAISTAKFRYEERPKRES